MMKYLALILFSIFLALGNYQESLDDGISVDQAEIILDYNYQNGIIISEDTRVIANENNCANTSINNNPTRSMQSLEINSYYMKAGDDNISYSYSDENLEKVDSNLTKTIISEAKSRTRDEVSMGYFSASVYSFWPSNFNIVVALDEPEDESLASTVLGEFLYKNDKFVCEIDASGNVRNAYLLQ